MESKSEAERAADEFIERKYKYLRESELRGEWNTQSTYSFQEAYLAGYERGSPKWIPVGERLPDGHDQVLIWPRNKYAGAVCSFTCYEMKHDNIAANSFYFDPEDSGYYAEVSGVTHWMPLPTPPKAEGEK